ncbi:MAG: ABC transporter permease, partial [Bacteroidota bacterium]
MRWVVRIDVPRRFIERAFGEYGIGVAFLIEILVFSQLSEYFLTAENILNVTLQTSITAIIAVGMTFVILTAGIDLSVGALLAFSGVVATSLLNVEMPLAFVFPLAIVVGLVIGAFSGLFSGFFVTKFNITPFIVTLALMTIWRGAAYMYTAGHPIWGLPEEFGVLGSGRIAEIPIPTIIMVVTYALAYVVLKHTPFGRHVYAVGGNREAARLAGVNTNRVLLSVYVICGVLSALSGILLASRMNSGQPNAGLMYELDVIAAVVV